MPEVVLPEQIQNFDFEAISAVWQGDRVIRNQGKWEAWYVEGDQVTTFSNGEERQHTLQFLGPCKLGLGSAGDAGWSTDLVEFGLLEGEILHGVPVAQQGTRIAACEGSDIVYFDGTACTYFTKKTGQDKTHSFESEAAECEIKAKGEWGDFLYFKTESMGRSKEAKVFHAIDEISEDLRGETVRTRYASFEEAKAALQ